jgi:SAM-dependent methyltransferase
MSKDSDCEVSGLSRRLNVGCGTDIKSGHVNMDCVALPGVDVVHDIEQLPWPFPDGSFDEVICFSVLEHVSLVPTMREIHRVLRPGGITRITVPHFTAAGAYQDPTHRNFLSCGVFEFFTKKSSRPYYFDFTFDCLESLYLVFGKRKLFWWNYLLERWVNGNSRRIGYYEDSPLRVFPAMHFDAVLKK